MGLNIFEFKFKLWINSETINKIYKEAIKSCKSIINNN